MQIQLHTPHSLNGGFKCGPAVLSALTGKSVEALGVNRAMTNFELKTRIQNEGFEVTPVSIEMQYYDRVRTDHWSGVQSHERVTNGPTIVRFLRGRTEQQRASVIVISTRNHFIVTHRDWIIDNQHPDGVPFDCYRLRRQRIHTAWIITKKEY